MRKTNRLKFRLPGLLRSLVPVMAMIPFGALHAQDRFTDTSFNTPAYTSNPVVAATAEFPEILKGNEAFTTDYIKQFSNRRRDYLIRMYSKGKKLLPKAAGIFKKYNLPEELKVLMILESAYNPNAVSKAGAVGYWQFMDAVAKEYGLKYVPQEKKEAVVLNKKERKKGKKGKAAETILLAKTARHKGKETDERKNFNKATIAAARYLRDRKVNLDGNWLLVVASYNCGVGNVWEAMEKSGKENPSFWDIKKYLPAETQAYVMNFITLNVVYSNYDQFLKNNLVFAAPVSPAENCNDELQADGTDVVEAGFAGTK